MVRNYVGFRKQIKELVTLRSRNYVNTDCNIDMLMHVVFAEIATEVNLMWDVQTFTLNSDQLTYTFPSYDILDADDDDDDDSEEFPDEDNNEYASKFFTEIHEIVDSEGHDVSTMFTELSADVITIEQEMLDRHIDDDYRILRSVVPSIKILEPWMYQLMLKPMIEGMMFEIQDSVPSETDGKLGNLQYQRFFNAKKFLKEKLPQRNWISSKQPGTNIVEEGVL